MGSFCSKLLQRVLFGPCYISGLNIGGFGILIRLSALFWTLEASEQRPWLWIKSILNELFEGYFISIRNVTMQVQINPIA